MPDSILRLVAVALAPLAALGLAACGGDSGSDGDGAASRTTAEVAAEVRGLTGDDLTGRLAELAADEDGRLSLYTSITDTVAEEIAERFGTRFDIEVSLYAASDDDLTRRVSEEASAGRLGADVIETNTLGLVGLAREGALERGIPVDAEGIDERAVADEWVANRYNRFAVSWNTKLVPAGERPRRWEELADGRWDGRLGLELGDFDWYAGLVGYWQQSGKSNSEIRRLFERMAQGSKVIKGHSLTGQLTASGEISVAASNYTHIVDRSIRDGLPLAWEPAVEPVFLRANGIGIGKGTKRPASAALFVQWALTEGAELYEQNGWLPARGATTRKDGAESVVIDTKALAEDEERWRTEYDRLVRRGTIVEEE